MTDAPDADLVTLEEVAGGVVIVRLNRPPLNPLSAALLARLAEVARSLAADPVPHAVVVAGSEKAFAAGADIEELAGGADARAVCDRFRAAWPTLVPMGFDERFRRLWEYYLAYCEAGFLSGNIDVRQVVFANSG